MIEVENVFFFMEEDDKGSPVESFTFERLPWRHLQNIILTSIFSGKSEFCIRRTELFLMSDIEFISHDIRVKINQKCL